MTPWLSDFPAVRHLPRLWVETVWLLESREPLIVTRTIELHPGLNIVWAREPDSSDASGLASAGHGVGKTSLCLLLRYVLGDDASAITALREKTVAAFPKGGVAAKVHVDGVAWLVFRPYGAYSHSMAKQCGVLEQLFDTDTSSDFQGYLSDLESASIGRLTAQSLPGTNQPVEWRHLLASGARDDGRRGRRRLVRRALRHEGAATLDSHHRHRRRLRDDGLLFLSRLPLSARQRTSTNRPAHHLG